MDGSNVSCRLKRNKLKGSGTTGDSTEITYTTPISTQVFPCFAIPDIFFSSSKQRSATPSSVPLYFVVGKRK
jgi:hypothetical protein